MCLGILWERREFSRPTLRIAVGMLVGLSFVFQLAGVMVDMNLHYHRLLKNGVIQNVNSYSFPDEDLLRRTVLALYSRWSEIRGLFDKGLVPTPDPSLRIFGRRRSISGGLIT